MFPLLIGSSTAWASDEKMTRKARAAIAIASKARDKTICGCLTSLLGIGGLVTFTYLYQKGDQSEVYAQKNESGDAKPSKEKGDSTRADALENEGSDARSSEEKGDSTRADALENEGSDARSSEEEGDSTRADALENEGSDARPSEEKKNSIPTSEKVIKHSPDVGQDKKVVPSISSSIGIYPLLFTLIVLGGLYLFLYRDFYFSALPQPAAADDADSAEGDVLSGEEGEATPSGTEAGKYPILLGVLVLIGSVALYIYTNYSGEEDDQVEESA